MGTIGWFSFYCLLFLIKIAYSYEQDKYVMIYERADVSWFNRSYSNQIKFVNFKYNRTCAVTMLTNMTMHLNKALGNNMLVRIQAYKFMSNEYRLFPMRFQFNLCAYAKKNEFGLHKLFECGNFSCPVKEGLYSICYFSLDGKRFPPLIPEGQWKLELVYLDGLNEILQAYMYGSNYYPIK